MQRLPDTLTKSTQNISKSFEVPIQHQQYFVPNLPPQCDTNTTICLKTLDIDAKRYIAINIATLWLGPAPLGRRLESWSDTLAAGQAVRGTGLG